MNYFFMIFRILELLELLSSGLTSDGRLGGVKARMSDTL